MYPWIHVHILLSAPVSRHSKFHINYFVILPRLAGLCILHTIDLFNHLRHFFKDSTTAAAVNDRFQALTVS